MPANKGLTDACCIFLLGCLFSLWYKNKPITRLKINNSKAIKDTRSWRGQKLSLRSTWCCCKSMPVLLNWQVTSFRAEVLRSYWYSLEKIVRGQIFRWQTKTRHRGFPRLGTGTFPLGPLCQVKPSIPLDGSWASLMASP